MSRAAGVLLLAALGLPACHVTLRFDGSDASGTGSTGTGGSGTGGVGTGAVGSGGAGSGGAGTGGFGTGGAGRDASPPDARTGCATDLECPLASLHCEPSSGQCFSCASDDDCAGTTGRPRCDSASHLCVQCGTSKDCSAGWVCTSTSVCVKSCTATGDCPAGNFCDDSICVQCDDDFHCTGTRPYCDPNKGQCVACYKDTQCTSSAAPRCNLVTGTCVACLTGADCAAGKACDPTSWACVAPTR